MIFPEGKFLPRVVYDPLTMTAASVAGAGMSAAGTLMGAGSQASALRAQAPADMLAAAYAAQEAKWAGDEALAASQRKAQEISAAKRDVESKLQAGAAAGGGDTSDDTVQNLAAGIENRGEYQKLMELYAGETRANALWDRSRNLAIGGVNRANADNYKADMISSQAPFSAVGTMLSSGSSAFDKYGTRAWDQIKKWSEG